MGRIFITVNLAERKRALLVDYVDVLRSVIREVKEKHPFHIDAMVILPDHLHAVWTLPVAMRTIRHTWMLIKAGFSRNMPKGEWRNASRVTRGERGSGNGGIGNVRLRTAGITHGTSITAFQSRRTRPDLPAVGLALIRRFAVI